MSSRQFTPAFSLNLPLVHQGKTRETYSVPEDRFLVVATGRLSTHNVVHQNTVPFKGEVLTALTVFWLRKILGSKQIPHHLLASGSEIYNYLSEARNDYPPGLHHRAIVVRKLGILPVEFIFRGYLTGSLFREFYAKDLINPYGIDLKAGLPLMKPFKHPIFTPTDKSETDDPLNARETEERYPKATDISRRTFHLIREHLRKLGLELVDSKFEIGVDDTGCIMLADEIATPDSSRFCMRSDIKLGKEPAWLDKQIARDEAERIWGRGSKASLEFSPEVVDRLSRTYLYIFKLVTGRTLEDFQREYLD